MLRSDSNLTVVFRNGNLSSYSRTNHFKTVWTVQTWSANPARRYIADKRGVIRCRGGMGVISKSNTGAELGSAKVDETLVGVPHDEKMPVSPALPAVGTGVGAIVGV